MGLHCNVLPASAAATGRSSSATGTPAASSATATSGRHKRTPHRSQRFIPLGRYLRAADDLVIFLQTAKDLYLGIVVETGSDLLLDEAVAIFYPDKRRSAGHR